MNSQPIKIGPISLKKENLIDAAVILLTIAIFIWIKLDGITWRFSDSSGYFYMARQLLKGQLPYRDFLIADPPLLIYLLAGVKLIVREKIVLFQWLPIILETTTSMVLYSQIKKKLPKVAKFFPFIYLFSFLILSTSDYVTGLHFITLFLALAYRLRKKPIAAGIFWGLATLIKLYVIPGFIAWMIWLAISKKWLLLKKTLISYVLTGSIIMLPFLIAALPAVFEQIIIHQFNRPKGLSKLNVFRFFIQHDFLLLLLTAVSLFMIKNLKFILLISSWLLFYLLFKDLYYLYLAVLAPFLVLTIADLLSFIQHQSKNEFIKTQSDKIAIITVFSIILSQLIGINFYKTSIQPEGIFKQLPAVVEFVSNLPARPIYGSHEAAPLIALKTGGDLFNNYIDTNAQIFGSGLLNKQQVSQQAVEEGVYLLTKVADVPQNADVDTGYQGYFDQSIFNEYCRRLEIIHGTDAGLFNDIAVYECQK